MICLQCLQAGRNNKANNEGKAMRIVAALHVQCTAPTTCPCQHRIGVFSGLRGRS